MRYESQGTVATTAIWQHQRRAQCRALGTYDDQEDNLVDVKEGEEGTIEQSEENGWRNGVVNVARRGLDRSSVSSSPSRAEALTPTHNQGPSLDECRGGGGEGVGSDRRMCSCMADTESCSVL